MDIFHPWVAESTNGMRPICDDEGQREFVLESAIEFSSPIYVGPPNISLHDWDKAFL